MINADFAFADIPTLSRAFCNGGVSAVDLATFFLDRLHRIGRGLNAVVALDAPGALLAAAEADTRRLAGRSLGPLDGIPFAVKDNIFTASLPTLLGVSRIEPPLPRMDAEVVRRLKDQGAVLLGKLSLMELLAMLPFEHFDASATGACRNPYDTGAWTGDSSTGPAAAVAAGLVPFALATETHGSIVQPAAFCGAVGLRPTFGAGSTDGVFVVAPSVDCVGPIARTPDDALLVARAIGSVGDLPRAAGPIRIGVLEPIASADPEVKANFHIAADRLSQVARLTPVALPDLPVAECFRTLLVQEARQRYAPLIASGTLAALVSPTARDGGYLAEPTDVDAHRSALRERERIDLVVRAWLRPFDAVLAVTNPRVAPPLDTTFSAWFGDDDHEPITTVGALLGLPALTIPCGLGAAMRPVGIQLVGPQESEAKLTAIANSIFARLPRLRPPTAATDVRMV